MMGQDLRSCNRFGGQDTKKNRLRPLSLTVLFAVRAQEILLGSDCVSGLHTRFFSREVFVTVLLAPHLFTESGGRIDACYRNTVR